MDPQPLLGSADQVEVAEVDHILADELVVQTVGNNLSRQVAVGFHFGEVVLQAVAEAQVPLPG